MDSGQPFRSDTSGAQAIPQPCLQRRRRVAHLEARPHSRQTCHCTKPRGVSSSHEAPFTISHGRAAAPSNKSALDCSPELRIRTTIRLAFAKLPLRSAASSVQVNGKLPPGRGARVNARGPGWPSTTIEVGPAQQRCRLRFHDDDDGRLNVTSLASTCGPCDGARLHSKATP